MTPNFAEQAEKYTAAWDVKINDPALKPLKIGYLHNKAEVQGHFLAGCAHGYRVGKAEAASERWRAGAATDEVMRLRDDEKALLAERDQLKAQLAELDTQLKLSQAEAQGIEDSCDCAQLKARLADAEKALKEIRGIQEAGIHENGGRVAEKQAIESWIKFGLQELTKHPQDGAKGDL